MEVSWSLRAILLSCHSILPNFILFPFPHLLDHLLRYNLLFNNPVMFHWAEDSTMKTNVKWVIDGSESDPNLSGYLIFSFWSIKVT